MIAMLKNILKSVLKPIPSWSAIKYLGRSKVIQSSYFWLFFVPVVAKLLSSAPDLVPITLGTVAIPVKMALPFSWKLFYLSAVFFSVASLLYEVSCPKGIKKYDNFVEYEEKGKDSSSLILAFISLYRKKSWLWPFEMPDNTKNYFVQHLTGFQGNLNLVSRSDNKIPTDLIKAGIPDQSKKAAFYYVTDQYDASKPFSRAFACGFYLAGFLAFGAVLVENFVFVMQHQ